MLFYIAYVYYKRHQYAYFIIIIPWRPSFLLFLSRDLMLLNLSIEQLI